MSGVNKAIIVGYLGRDPEVRYTKSGQTVASFSVATSEKWTDKATGNKEEKTEWHRITAWGELGKICGEYLTKGQQVYIEGKLQTREWEDKDGVKRQTTEIVASNMTMLGSASNNSNNSGSQDNSEKYGIGEDNFEDPDLPF